MEVREGEIEVDFAEVEVVHPVAAAEVDLVTEEVEEGPEEHQEVVALPEEAAAEVQEVEASLGQKEAQKLSSNLIGTRESSWLVEKKTCW